MHVLLNKIKSMFRFREVRFVITHHIQVNQQVGRYGYGCCHFWSTFKVYLSLCMALVLLIPSGIPPHFAALSSLPPPPFTLLLRCCSLICPNVAPAIAPVKDAIQHAPDKKTNY
jgi:hypothetical protein